MKTENNLTLRVLVALEALSEDERAAMTAASETLRNTVFTAMYTAASEHNLSPELIGTIVAGEIGTMFLGDALAKLGESLDERDADEKVQIGSGMLDAAEKSIMESAEAGFMLAAARYLVVVSSLGGECDTDGEDEAQAA